MHGTAVIEKEVQQSETTHKRQFMRQAGPLYEQKENLM